MIAPQRATRTVLASMFWRDRGEDQARSSLRRALSDTRAALGAGGIGLLLVETINTSRDWENTLYIIILTVIVVIMMDMMSSWLRRRLIGT